MTRLLVINIARKPLSEPSVARNVLRWGAGALDIDGVRLGASPPSVPQPSFRSPTGLIYGFEAGEGRNGEMSDNSKGRWPANLILQHKAGCKKTGLKKIKGNIGSKVGMKNPMFEGGWKPGPVHAYVDKDGNEMVDSWDCVPDCPIKDLNFQSGASESPSNPITRGQSPLFGIGSKGLGVGYGDKGGASRYFKQIQEESHDKE